MVEKQQLAWKPGCVAQIRSFMRDVLIRLTGSAQIERSSCRVGTRRRIIIVVGPCDAIVDPCCLHCKSVLVSLSRGLEIT